jgi:hypothetical protein
MLGQWREDEDEKEERKLFANFVVNTTVLPRPKPRATEHEDF